MNIAILMMQKNEVELLDKWVRYHANLVGSSNLFIFDNGSTEPAIIDQLEKFESQTINVRRDFNTKADYENRGNLFCEEIKKLDKIGIYDFYMVIDCDEFLAVVDQEGNICCDTLSLEYSLNKLKNNTQLLMIDSQYYNSSISPNWFNKQPYRKCFFKKNTIKELDQGFHLGKVTTSDQELRTNLVHIHFHNKPYQIAKMHAQEKLQGRVKDFNFETLKKYKGKGFHLVRFFFEDEQQYVQGQIALNHTKSKSLFHKFEQLDLKWPYIDHVRESRVLLELTGEDDGFSKVLPKFRGSIDSISIVNNKIEIKGWGIVNYSRPVKHVFLKLKDNKLFRFNIVERKLREDVNNMLNIKGVNLGFVAEIEPLALQNMHASETPKIETFLDSNQKFYEFDMHRKHREFDYLANFES